METSVARLPHGFIVISLCLVIFNIGNPVLAQVAENSRLKFNVIPPAPEAASLGKYIDMPVNAYTGLPKIEIPIYELKSYELSLPISLSYHASGIKWEEIPSFIGHGWSLNTGGIISRSIRGFNDEEPNIGFFSTSPDVSAFFNANGSINYSIFNNVLTGGNCPPVNSAAYSNYLNVLLASKGGLDLEPDVFFFSLPDGQSGKFVFSRSKQLKFIPDQYANLSYTANPVSGQLFYTWKAVGKDGTQYFFEKQEITNNWSTCREVLGNGAESYNIPDVNAPSSWKLTKIKSANNLDSIWFEYESEGLQYQTTTSSTSYDRLSGNIAVPGNSTCINQTTVAAWRLKKIHTKAGYMVEFIANSNRSDLTGGKFLDEIKIFHKGSFIKRYRLTRGGAIPTLISLEEIFEELTTTTKTPAYEFAYHTEGVSTPTFSQTSYNLDHWGYYNGENVQTNSFPTPAVIHQNIYYAGANREPLLEACRWMTLKEIKYPTGGTSSYEYELNDYSNIPTFTDVIYSPGLQLIETVEFSVTNTNLPTAYQTKPFTLSAGTNIVVLFEIPSVPGGGIPATGLSGSLSKTGDPGFATRYYTAGQAKISSAPIETFSAGNYTLYGEFTDGAHALGNQKFYIKVYKVLSLQDRIQNNTLKGGGLRIKKITNSGDQTLTKTYRYTHHSSGISSGVLMSFPMYASLAGFVEGQGSPSVACNVTASGNFLIRTNSTSVPLGVAQGAAVGYSEVTEYHGLESANNGYSIFTFTNTPETVNPLAPYVPNQSFGYKNGLLLTQLDFSNAHKLVKRVMNEYTYLPDPAGIVQGLKVNQPVNTSCSGCINRSFGANAYGELTERVQLTKVTEMVYDLSTDGFMEHQSSFTYDPYDQLSLKQQTISNPGNRKLYTTYSYHSVLKTTPVEEYSYYAENNTSLFQFLGGAKTTLHPTLYKPTEIWLLEPTLTTYAQNYPSLYNLYKRRLQFLSFDNFGNVLTYQKENSLTPTSVIWDSDKRLPIAQVENASSTQVAHSSFENSSNEGGFSFVLAANTSEKKTGKQSHNLTTPISFGSLELNKRYILSYWAKNGTPTVTKVVAHADDAAPGVDGWRYFEKVILSTSGTVVTISGTGTIQIDELRLYPETARMTTYTHDPQKGISSMTDLNHFTTYFEYNPRLQLEYIKDFQYNILKKNEYRYSRDN